MSSHWEWSEKVIAKHDLERPFAPENGQQLKFKIGDAVIFTNDYGLEFNVKITGYFKREPKCSMYAVGYRYLTDSLPLHFPTKEASLRIDCEL